MSEAPDGASETDEGEPVSARLTDDPTVLPPRAAPPRPPKPPKQPRPSYAAHVVLGLLLLIGFGGGLFGQCAQEEKPRPVPETSTGRQEDRKI